MHNEAKQHLLSAAMLLAPTGKEQQAFVQYFKDVESSGHDARKEARLIVGGLYDGLAYGNWPGMQHTWK